MLAEQHTMSNISSCRRKQLEKRWRCVAECARLVSCTVIDCVRRVEALFHLQEYEISPSARFGRHTRVERSSS
jgi:hypothetical protein